MLVNLMQTPQTLRYIYIDGNFVSITPRLHLLRPMSGLIAETFIFSHLCHTDTQVASSELSLGKAMAILVILNGPKQSSINTRSNGQKLVFLGSGAETLVRWGRAEHFVPAVRRLVPTIQFQRNYNRSGLLLGVGIQGFPDEVL